MTQLTAELGTRWSHLLVSTVACTPTRDPSAERDVYRTRSDHPTPPILVPYSPQPPCALATSRHLSPSIRFRSSASSASPLPHRAIAAALASVLRYNFIGAKPGSTGFVSRPY